MGAAMPVPLSQPSIARAVRFIRLHATEPLTLARIAHAAGCSPFHFARLFKAMTGETAFARVTRLRVGIAVRMLADGRHAVFRFRGPYRDIGSAFDAVWARWVARAGVVLRPAPCLEIYVHGGERVPESERLTDLCVPLE